MFTVQRISANCVDIQINGKIDAKQMTAGLDALINQSADIDNGVMLYEITDGHVPSLRALMAELRRLPALVNVMTKFRRVAVLTDTYWLKKASELEGAMLPNIDIKAFDSDQRLAAEAWLLRA